MSEQTIIQGDCLQEMRVMPDCSITHILTDPPYGLHFMGKDCDNFKKSNFDERGDHKFLHEYGVDKRSCTVRKIYSANSAAGTYDERRNDEFQEFMFKFGKEALRIVKPGGHILMFGAPRRFHRQICGLEDAGWEIRDCISWIFGSGFPKSHNKFGFDGYGTALKPAWEPILVCSKPYEIMSLFVIMLHEITNQIYGVQKCQKLNLNANDAEIHLSDSLLLLDKVQGYTVQGNAKICAQEKLSDVQFVIKNFTYLKQELSEKINLAKDVIALINARDNGNQKIAEDQTILSGEVDVILTRIRDIVTCVLMGNIEPNIGLLWKNILVGIFQGMSKFTISMVLSLITELKTLKSCLHPNILNDIGNLSPNWEPIIVAMKPLDGTFKQNAEKWGVAGINIDASRIGESGATARSEQAEYPKNEDGTEDRSQHWARTGHQIKEVNKGRWPANLILDEEAGALLGEPARFFYCAKASSAERNAGLEGMPLIECGTGALRDCGRGKTAPNSHPTVKPIKLMEYLLKLITPPNGGIVLDPFCGSGSTLVAARNLGINAVGIELQEEYCEIARRRIDAG